MATKVNADNLQKLSTTHKNVSVSVKEKTSKAQATTTKLKLDTSRNPAVKTVPARAQAVAQRVNTKGTTIDTRSVELAKRADYVREQAAKASSVKAPTGTAAMPVTTASATRARAAAAKLSSATKSKTIAPVVKPIARKPAIKPKAATTTQAPRPVVQSQTRPPATKRKTATRTQRTAPVMPTPAPPITRPKTPAPTLKRELQAEIIVYKREGFLGVKDKRTVRGVDIESRAGLSGDAQLSLTGEWKKAELVAKLGSRLTVESKATTGFDIGRQRIGLEGSAKAGGILEAEGALKYGPTGGSLRGKAEAFIGVKADAETSWEVWPGVKLLVGGGVRGGAGYEGEGEATLTAKKMVASGSLGATALVGAKIKGGIEVDLSKAGKAVAAEQIQPLGPTNTSSAKASRNSSSYSTTCRTTTCRTSTCLPTTCRTSTRPSSNTGVNGILEVTSGQNGNVHPDKRAARI
jgi:hypothetical protein